MLTFWSSLPAPLDPHKSKIRGKLRFSHFIEIGRGNLINFVLYMISQSLWLVLLEQVREESQGAREWMSSYLDLRRLEAAKARNIEIHQIIAIA